MRLSYVALCVACLAVGCRRPRDGLITAGVGGGIAIGGFALGGYIDRDKSAPDSGFAVSIGSLAVGGTLIAVGLLAALVLELGDPVLSSGKGKSPRGLGDEALEAARSGDCPRALELAEDVRAIDTEYYARVLDLDVHILACRR